MWPIYDCGSSSLPPLPLLQFLCCNIFPFSSESVERRKVSFQKHSSRPHSNLINKLKNIIQTRDIDERKKRTRYKNVRVSTVGMLRKCKRKKLRIYNTISYPYYQLKYNIFRAEIVLAQLKFLQFGHKILKIWGLPNMQRQIIPWAARNIRKRSLFKTKVLGAADRVCFYYREDCKHNFLF